MTADGVTWLTPGQTGDVVMWTSEGYAPGLELSVPSSINDQQNILAELAPAVTRCLRLIPAPSLSVSSVRP